MGYEKLWTFFSFLLDAGFIVTSGLFGNGTEVMSEIRYPDMGLNEIRQSYPLDVWGATGGFLAEKYVFLCGGFLKSKPIKECHSIFEDLDKKLSMQQARALAASVVIRKSTLWVTGRFLGYF